MIKAKKGLLITLFAAMMVFAFGATSSFASTDYSSTATWDLANHTVTIDGQTYGGVDVTFYENDDVDGSSGDVTYYAGQTVAHFDNGTVAATKVFYDLNGAEIASINGVAVQANYAYAAYNALDEGNVLLTLKRPSYATIPTSTSAKATGVALNTWATTASIAELEKSTATQTGTISVLLKVADGVTSPAELDGTVASKTVYVQGESATMGLKLDTEKKDFDGTYSAAYDGKSHVLVANDVSGYTVAYQKFNSTTGKWDAVDSIAFKNVEDNGTYRAVYTKDGKETPVTAKVAMIAADKFTFGFDTETLTAAGNTVAKSTDPAAFVKVTGLKSADSDEAMKYFAETYDITVKVNAANDSLVTWTIAAKEGVKAADIYKAYTVLSDNYGLTKDDIAQKTSEATSKVNITLKADPDVDTKADDINFTAAPNKTYKAKKKTKKLAKNKTFTVAAVADSGNAVRYSLSSPTSKIKINATTGKVTVKKGLKKGTYKVTVKAKTDKGNGYAAAKESVQLTIKIKK